MSAYEKSVVMLPLKADYILNIIGSVDDYNKKRYALGPFGLWSRFVECLALEKVSERTALYLPFRRKPIPLKE